MTFKTILVHVDDSVHAATRITLASALALQYDAHLVGAAFTGVSRFFYQDSGADLARTLLAPYMDGLFQQTEQALGHFSRLASAAGVPSYEARLVDDEAGAGLVLAGHYADLLVLGQSEPGAPSTHASGDLAAWVLLSCPRPLLVIPYARSDTSTGRRVLVAWNGSAEAVRALTAAQPFLRRADSVTVATFDTRDEPAEPDQNIVPYLKRHGVDAALVAESTRLDLGDRLLSLIADRNADLLVMGGYGRTRLRELLLGGVTRTILRAMTVPVLLTH